MEQFIDSFVGLFRQPPIFLGFVALLGLTLQKKSVSNIAKGTFKTIIGMIILMKGVGIVIEGINPLAGAFNKIFALEGASELGDFTEFLEINGSTVGMVLLIGFVLNILIARFTRFKTIFLTGNILFWMPMLFIAVGIENKLHSIGLVTFAVIFHILYVVLVPHFMRPHVKQVTGNEMFTVGHTAAIYCFIGSYIGKFIGDKENSTEKLNLPKSFEFFRETTLTSGIVIAVVYLIVGAVDTSNFASENLLSFSIINGMTFAAGMLILLQGTRMMLGEIVPAFKGISDKLAPGSIPALDIPMIFPFAPTALLLGFVVSTTTSIVSIFIFGYMGVFKVAIIPLTVACYFDVAPGAIFANAYGGKKAAILTSALSGVIMVILVGISLPIVSNTVGTFVQAYGGNDFSLWIILASVVATNKVLGAIVIGIVLAVIEFTSRKRSKLAIQN